MKINRKDLEKRTGGFIGEFKEFIARGNVLDMAVGVIIGGAFGSISSSLVNDVIMPLLSLLTGGISFDDWKLVLRPAEIVDGETVSEALTVNYGAFLSTVLNFFLVAFAVFLLIKAMNTAARKAAELARLKKDQKKQEEAAKEAEAAEKPETTEQLLGEIRDLLKEQRTGADDGKDGNKTRNTSNRPQNGKKKR